MLISEQLFFKPIQENTMKHFQLDSNQLSFGEVLKSRLPNIPIEAAVSSTFSDVKQKKNKDTVEILEDYKEEREEIYDVLTLEKKIRTMFRKLN